MTVKQTFISSAELNYPKVLPTLDLNFAHTRTLDPRITFTRASGGSYVGSNGFIKYAGVNEPRFDHDPETGESLGLLIEESRSNLVTFSQGSGMNDLNWNTNSGAVIVQTNSTVAPDGSLTANKVSASAVSELHLFNSNTFSVTSGVIYTFSCFFKAAESSWVYFRTGGTPFGANGYIFNISDGTLGVAVNTLDSAPVITKYPNGWYRISITKTASLTGNGLLQIIVPNNNSTSIFAGDGTSGIYVWGAQLEQGSFPTSYIPTQESTRTRAADNASITGKNFSDFFNFYEGTAFVDVYYTPSSINGIALNFSDTGAFGSNRIQMTNNGIVAYLVNGAIILNNTSVVSQNLSRYKLLTSYKLNDIIIAANGSYVTRPGRGIPPQNMTTMTIGSYPGGGLKINKSISRIIYFPKCLPNEQLQALTR